MTTKNNTEESNINEINIVLVLNLIINKYQKYGKLEDIRVIGDNIKLFYDGEWKNAYKGSVKKNIISDLSQGVRPSGGVYNFIKSFFNFDHFQVLDFIKRHKNELNFDGNLNFSSSGNYPKIEKEPLSDKEYSNENILKIYEKILKNKDNYKLTEEVYSRLEKRGIKRDTVNKEEWYFGTIEYNGSIYKDKIIIPILNGFKQVIGLKLRDLFVDRDGFKKEFKSISVKGSSTGLMYHIKSLIYGNVYIQEGEMDYLILKQLNFKNILSNTGGVMAFHKDWLELLKDKNIYIMYDKDKAGEKGVEKIKTILEYYKKYNIKGLYSFNMGKQGEDINDLYLRFKKEGLSDNEITDKIKKGFKKIF